MKDARFLYLFYMRFGQFVKKLDSSMEFEPEDIKKINIRS